MSDIDKWFAKSCKVDIFHNNQDNLSSPLWTTPDYNICVWTIDDPRCREVIRSKFRIVTNCDEVTGAKTDSEWEAECCVQHKDYISCKTGYGESIKEAEIDLLNRIYKAR